MIMLYRNSTTVVYCTAHEGVKRIGGVQTVLCLGLDFRKDTVQYCSISRDPREHLRSSVFNSVV